MTKTEPTAAQERAAIVAWLRQRRGNKLGLLARLWLAWMVLRHGCGLAYFAARVTASNYIERGEHHNGEGK